MRRKYRYGIFIASAILACVPWAMNNNVVKADAPQTQGTSSESNPTQGSIGDDQQQSKSSDGTQEGGTAKAKTGTTSSSDSGKPEKDPLKTNSGDLNINDGRDYAHAFQVSVSYDQNMHTDIKLTDGLTDDDITDYFYDNIHVSINNKEAKGIEDSANYNDEQLNKMSEQAGHDVTYDLKTGVLSVNHDKEGHIVARNDSNSMLVQAGDTVTATSELTNILVPNKWYSWQLHDNFFEKGDPIERATNKLGKLPDEITARIYHANGSNIIAMKTDDKGKLPIIQSKPDIDSGIQEYYLGADQIAPSVTFTVSNDLTNKNLFEITHNPDNTGAPRDLVSSAPVVPDDNKDRQDTTPTDIPNDPDANSSDWDSTSDPEIKCDNFELSPVEENDVQNTIQKTEQNIKNTDPSVNDETKDGAKKIADIDGLVFVHNAFIYNKYGKVIKDKNDAYEIKRVDQKAKILDGGKTYSFPNQKGEFYRIGKDRYIKAANVGRVTNKVQSIRMRGTIKASHKYGVKLYNSKGKFTKKVLYNARKVRFDQKKYMHGRIFYRIQGTNIWVRKGNIKF